MYTVIHAVHSLLYIKAKCHLFSVVTWKYLIKYLQICEWCTHFFETLYMFVWMTKPKSNPFYILIINNTHSNIDYKFPHWRLHSPKERLTYSLYTRMENRGTRWRKRSRVWMSSWLRWGSCKKDDTRENKHLLNSWSFLFIQSN